MRLRMYHAPRMAEAMAMLRDELGEDAVILETRRVAGGVEVTAAQGGRAAPAPALPEEGSEEEPLLILPGPVLPGPPAYAAELRHHNLPSALAIRLGGSSQHNGALTNDILAERLRDALGFAPLPDAVHRPLLLAGPPGAGKTMTCAKLATRAVLGGSLPLIITSDRARAGATEQLAAFTRLLGLTLAVAPQPASLIKALARREPGQAVLIDTAGCDPLDPAQSGALLALTRAADAEMVFVMPAGLDPDEAAELAEGFAALGARYLLPTRLDVSRRLGGVLAAAAAGLALTEAGIGPNPADSLHPIDAEWLAGRLLARFGREYAA